MDRAVPDHSEAEELNGGNTIYSTAAYGHVDVIARMRCDNFDGYSPMFATGTVQDFDPAFYAANGCTAHTCDVVAGYRYAEGSVKDGACGKENNAEVGKENNAEVEKKAHNNNNSNQ
ncbi:hypothetical protein HO133_009067 [Letharia lupina]|uniref:Uncharacterized protein n=1 Tax=Letharia lupina TaxID=560253 RepID=A0A8H6CN80_9LECA|nr:uncharacterized protein HO133_009067 [Letharia lupina]KAF6226201.1 hypothetical protein HO133_009067 [Letharia lupina]